MSYFSSSESKRKKEPESLAPPSHQTDYDDVPNEIFCLSGATSRNKDNDFDSTELNDTMLTSDSESEYFDFEKTDWQIETILSKFLEIPNSNNANLLPKLDKVLNKVKNIKEKIGTENA